MRTALGEPAFAAAWAAGAALAVEEAAACALAEAPAGEASQLPPDATAAEQLAGLTLREREVVVLIAQGKTNREIAQAMMVGVKTVKTYITRILNKLGFDSRLQIATWVIEQGLAGLSQSPKS